MLHTNRRYFLMGSLASAALARPARPQSVAETVGLGVVGTGNRGSFLLEQILALEGVRVTALCDTKPDRLDLAATAAAAHQPFTTDDYTQLLGRQDVDAILIATPSDLHVEMAIAALEADKHVYCEKPAGTTPESIGRLVKVARSSKAVFQSGLQSRSIARLAEAIGRIPEIAGDVLMIQAQRHASQDLAHDGPSADWLFDASRSGDIVVEMSVHNLDICNWAIGGRPERAAGFGGLLRFEDQPPGRTTMDGYTLSYEYPGGAKVAYSQVFFHPQEMAGGGQHTYIYATNGAVDLGNYTYYPHEPARRNRERPLARRSEEDPAAHMKAFLAAVRGEGEPAAGIEVGATAALTAILGREAIYQRKVIEWDDLGVTL